MPLGVTMLPDAGSKPFHFGDEILA